MAHANALRKQAFNPRTSVPAKDLEASIAELEADIELYEKATGETMPEPHRRMSLEDMCPERLCAFLRDQSPERFPTYEDMKLRISDWVADESNRGGAKSKAIGAIDGG